MGKFSVFGMGQLKRFSNKAQLLRYIAAHSDKDIQTLWEEYNKQIDN